MDLIINEDNLKVSEVQEFSSKVRAILVDENNKILIANYYNVILLPGGKVDNGETISTTLKRELREEVGQDYDIEELDYFVTLNYYQKNYPKLDGTFKNRLVKTHYYIGLYKDQEKKSQKLTERELKGNFTLELVSLECLENMIQNNINDNPRNIYFQNELLTVLASYKTMKQKQLNKK